MGGQPVAVRINQFCIFAIVRLEKLVRYAHPSFPDWKVAVKRSAHDPLFPREANRDPGSVPGPELTAVCLVFRKTRKLTSQS